MVPFGGTRRRKLCKSSEDSKLWTARMQEAWTRLRSHVEHLAPGELEKAHIGLRSLEYGVYQTTAAELVKKATNRENVS